MTRDGGEPETRYTRTSDGVRIAYQYLDGIDPLLLVVPAIGHQFEPIEAVPAWREYRAAVRGEQGFAIFDFRGVGLSGAYSGSATVDLLRLDIEAVVAALGNRPLVLLAYRGGAPPAVEFVKRHSHEVLCLLLAEPTAPGVPPAQETALRGNWEDAWYLAARASYDWSDRGEWKRILPRWLERLPQRVYWQQVEAMREYDMLGGLRQINVPLILSSTDWDREAASELVSALPGAELAVDLDVLVSARLGHRTRALLEPHISRWRRLTEGQAFRPPPVQVLTDRQREVLDLLALGSTNDQIAERLGIAPGTVKRHVSEILKRTGLRNRIQAARYAMEHARS